MKLSFMLNRLQRPLLLDGAMGTELERKGADISLPLWSARTLIENPELVLALHEEYIDAGADIITTNTFRTNIRTLRRAGIADRWQSLNALAVDCAKRARDSSQRDVLIAGSITTVEDCYRPELCPPPDELAAEHLLQAALLAKLGVDCLLCETINSISEAKAAANACAEIKMEFIVSFMCRDATTLLSGESLAEAIVLVSQWKPVAVGVNCGSLAACSDAVGMLHGISPFPVCIYANAGEPLAPEPSLNAAVPAEYRAYAVAWMCEGARIIGGCCYTTPDHVRMLRKMIEQDDTILRQGE